MEDQGCAKLFSVDGNDLLPRFLVQQILNQVRSQVRSHQRENDTEGSAEKPVVGNVASYLARTRESVHDRPTKAEPPVYEPLVTPLAYFELKISPWRLKHLARLPIGKRESGTSWLV